MASSQVDDEIPVSPGSPPSSAPWVEGGILRFPLSTQDLQPSTQELESDPEQWDYLRANKMGGGLFLIDEAMKWEEKEGRISLRASRLRQEGVKDKVWHGLSNLILSTPENLLESIIRNDIMKRIKEGSVSVPSKDRKQPCIYVQCLVDEHGNAPTARVMEMIINGIELYLRFVHEFPESDPQRSTTFEGGSLEPQSRADYCEFLRAIDNAFPYEDIWNPDWNEVGWHRYLLKNNSPDGMEMDERRTSLQTLIRAWRLRLVAIPAEAHDLPLNGSPIEVGYTKEASRREPEHESHESGTIGVMLSAAMCTYLQLPYRWEFVVVTYLFEDVQPPAGEALFSRYLGPTSGKRFQPSARGHLCHINVHRPSCRRSAEMAPGRGLEAPRKETA